MKPYKTQLFLLVLSIFLQACSDADKDKAAPQITAQGFTIEEVQEGMLGRMSMLRLRIESAGRIKHLRIKERSYEVDLATTPERSHFSLFGIEKRALLRTDVTLNFQNYVNQKLTQVGEFQFNIEVMDKKGQSANAILKVRLTKPEGVSLPIETGQFQLQRNGKSTVDGSELFGITWKTIDKIKVMVRVKKAEGGASKLTRFSLLDYEQLGSKEELRENITAAEDIDKIEFDTTNNAAVDQVLGVSNLGKYYMLRTRQSDTTLTYVGTIVTLNGEYKF